MTIVDEEVLARAAPEVIAMLNSGSSEPVAVVYQLRGGKGQLVPPADDMASIVGDIVDKLQRLFPGHPVKHNIFKNLGSFVLLAPLQVHKQVLQQPEIKAAVLNRGSRD